MRQVRGNARLLRRCTPLLAAASLTFPLTATSATAADARTPSFWLPSTASPTGEYQSRPDIYAPTLTTNGEDLPGLLLTTPNPDTNQADSTGVIYDEDGEVVWFGDAGPNNGYFDMEPITYQGEPALLLWDGTHMSQPGQEPSRRYVVLDSSYEEVATFQMKNGFPTDSHDIEFSADGSHVMMMSYEPVQYDLSPWGGPADAQVVDAVVQEQNVETGEVTFEWSALDHIPLDESQIDLSRPDPMGVFDVYHMNSLEYDTDGNLLISSRSTSTVYKLDENTGEIIWRFGGKNNDFAFDSPEDMPAFQHDARRLPDGTLSVFDNGTQEDPEGSRGASYELDEESLTAELVEELIPESPIFAAFAGSNRQQDNGDHLITFGNTGIIAEFEDGQEGFTGELEDGFMSYRAEVADWQGRPTTKPDAVLGEAAEDGSQTMYMSWNGATNVEGWLIEAGSSEDDLDVVGIARDRGFETGAEFTPDEDDQVYKITALGRFGQPLSSTTVTP